MQVSKDIESDGIQMTYITGYPSLAEFITSDRSKSTVIFKRFDRLSARNLLYLQAELVELEARQDAFDKEDTSADLYGKQSRRDWGVFKEKSEDPLNKRERDRMELVRQIREKIKEYSRKSMIHLDQHTH
jgi:predicted HTH domain antitoxin